MNGTPRRFGALSSSVDPNQLSLTVESAGKVLIGFVAWYAVGHMTDPAAATTAVQQIIDTVSQGIPLAFALWHACNGIWGAARKLIALFYPAAQ